MKKFILFTLAMLLMVTPAFAELKVGYVDLQQALNTCKAGKEAKGTISALVKKYEEEFKNEAGRFAEVEK